MSDRTLPVIITYLTIYPRRHVQMSYLFHIFSFIPLKNRNFNRKKESIVGVNEITRARLGKRGEEAEKLFKVKRHGRVDRPCGSVHEMSIIYNHSVFEKFIDLFVTTKNKKKLWS